MRMALPLDDFEWMDVEELENFDPLSMPSNEADEGYILEVTLDYPEDLHLEHNAFPLAPEHLHIDDTMLSPYAVNALQSLTRKKKYSADKLTATFRRREHYVCHGLNLRFYLEQGLKLVKIHRGLKFTQEPFIKNFIDLFTKKRAEATSKTEKDRYKLIINSLYGKMIENGANRMDCKFVSSKKAALLRNTDPRTQAHMIFDPRLSMAFMKKAEVNLNQSWAVGFSILELSKLHMQRMFYEKIRPAFDNDVSVLLSDTDSWVLVTKTKTADEALSRLKNVMDFSNYPDGHPLRDDRVKNLTGYLKNETPGFTIKEVVAVRSKTYCIVTEKDQSNRCKGVKENVKNQIKVEDYRKCVEGLHAHTITQHSIQSKTHVNRLIEQVKLAFSSFDDKRHLMCSIHSVPYGSRLIREADETSEKCYFCANPSLLR